MVPAVAPIAVTLTALSEYLGTEYLGSPLHDPNGYRGYLFRMEVSPSGTTWSATAAPVDPGRTGKYYYYIDETGEIRIELTREADRRSPPWLRYPSRQ